MSRTYYTSGPNRCASLAAAIVVAALVLVPSDARAQLESATTFGAIGFDGLFNYRIVSARFRFNEGPTPTTPMAMYAVQAQLLRHCDAMGDVCGLNNGTPGSVGSLDRRTFDEPAHVAYPITGGMSWYEPSRFTNSGDCWSGNDATCPTLSTQNIGMVGCLVPVYPFDPIGYVARSCIRDGFDGYVTFSWRMFWSPLGPDITESEFVVTPHWATLEFDSAGNPLGAYDVTVNPEPASMSLMAIGLLACMGARRAVRTRERNAAG